ncbi:enolase [Pancytospora philotis]|nr:enolase [Pancytospora philotis]
MKLHELVTRIKARQILTSRGEPTVEVDFHTAHGIVRSSVPSGASTGAHEARVVLDGSGSYGGRSVMRIVDLIDQNADTILSFDISSLHRFDALVCEISDAANFTLPLSACLYKLLDTSTAVSADLHPHLAVRSSGIPRPFFNVINGGLHAGNGLWCQEIMVTFRRDSVAENLECAVLFYSALKAVIAERFGTIHTSVGDEGGFAPPVRTIEACIELFEAASRSSGQHDYEIALDLAANSFYRDGAYHICTESDGAVVLDGHALADYYAALIAKYPKLCSIEDPFAEDDPEPWAYFYGRAGSKVSIVADDLTVSNPGLIKKYVSGGRKLFNTVLIKPNQIGCISGVFDACQAATASGCKLMVSHRSAETEDTLIAGLAAKLGVHFIKCGAPCRGERVAKYNELLRIEEARCEEKGVTDH